MNGYLISELEVLQRQAMVHSSAGGSDKYLALTYAKAIKSIKSHPQEITSGREALKLPGIGKYIAGKIDDLLTREPPKSQVEVASVEDYHHTTRTTRSVGYNSVAEWLSSLGFTCYLDAFNEAGFDNLIACQDLSESDLNQIGAVTKPGHRKTLIMSSKQLKEMRIAPTPSIAQPPSRSLSKVPSSDLDPRIHCSTIVTDSLIKANCTLSVLQRGESLYLDGSVISTGGEVGNIHATVRGSSGSMYDVYIETDTASLQLKGVRCSCPCQTTSEQWCKHVVAVMLSIKDKEAIVERKKPEKKAVKEKTKSSKTTKLTDGYMPSYRSGGWAILIALLEASTAVDFKGYLLKQELIIKAQNWCDVSFQADSLYTPWSSMSTLLKHQLVFKEKKPAQFSLTSAGKRLAKALHENRFQQTSIEELTSTNSAYSALFQDSLVVEIVLLLDYREVKKPSQEGLYNTLKHSGIHCEKRNLDLGDILWIARSGKQEYVLDFIVERKRVEDLASSIEDGRYKEQKFRLKRSGLKSLVYLIEGMIDPQRMDYFETELAVTQIDGFFVQRTQNEDETANYLINLTNHFTQLTRQELRTFSSGKRFEEFSSGASKSRNLTIGDIFAKQLLQFSGCTPDKANSITTYINSPATFTTTLRAENSDWQALSNIEYGTKKRKIGSALSRAISTFYAT